MQLKSKHNVEESVNQIHLGGYPSIESRINLNLIVLYRIYRETVLEDYGHLLASEDKKDNWKVHKITQKRAMMNGFQKRLSIIFLSIAYSKVIY